MTQSSRRRSNTFALKFVLRTDILHNYVDLILSMVHQPNIIVSDMANMVVHMETKAKETRLGHLMEW